VVFYQFYIILEQSTFLTVFNLYPNIQDADEYEMDQADMELREVVRKLWPFQDIKVINLAMPLPSELHGKNGTRKMTVGKIYAGLLMLENYRAYKMSLKLYGENRPVIIKIVDSWVFLLKFKLIFLIS